MNNELRGFAMVGSGKSGDNGGGRPYKLIRRNGRPAIVYEKKIWVLDGEMTDAELKEKAPQFIKLIQKQKKREKKRKATIKAKTTPTPAKNPVRSIINSAAQTPFYPSFVGKVNSEVDIKTQIEQIKKTAEDEKNKLKKQSEDNLQELKKQLEIVEQARISGSEQARINEIEQLLEEEKTIKNNIARERINMEEYIREQKDYYDNEIERIKMESEASNERNKKIIDSYKNKLIKIEEDKNLALKNLQEEYENKLILTTDEEKQKILNEEYENEKNNILDIVENKKNDIDESVKGIETSVVETIDKKRFFELVEKEYENYFTNNKRKITDIKKLLDSELMFLRNNRFWSGDKLVYDGREVVITNNGKIIYNEGSSKQKPLINSKVEFMEVFMEPVNENNIFKLARFLKIEPPIIESVGKGRIPGPDSLTNIELDEYAELSEIDNMFPTTSIDSLPDLEDTWGSIIVNTEPSYGDRMNGHWVAIRVNEDDSVEYFDPLGESPPDAFFEWLQEQEIDGQIKINQVKVQSDKSSTCGFHVLKFLIDRQDGRTWKEATGFNKIEKLLDVSDEAEKKIRPLIKDFRNSNISK